MHRINWKHFDVNFTRNHCLLYVLCSLETSCSSDTLLTSERARHRSTWCPQKLFLVGRILKGAAAVARSFQQPRFDYCSKSLLASLFLGREIDEFLPPIAIFQERLSVLLSLSLCQSTFGLKSPISARVTPIFRLNFISGLRTR